MQRIKNRPTVNSRRRGAATVEFAMVAPILFLCIFVCIEFGRLVMIESMVEQSAFETARNVAVVGATKQEGMAIAEAELEVLGINGASVLIVPTTSGVTQNDISLETDRVSVTVSVPLDRVLYFGWLADGRKIERTAVIDTERFEY